MPHTTVPQQELAQRLSSFRTRMHRLDETWSLALIDNKLSMFYFTGTMQDGMLVISPTDAVLFVRRSYERAKQESVFPNIEPMKSFRVIAETFSKIPKVVYGELGTLTMQKHSMLKKYLPFEEMRALDGVLSDLRAVKSDYEVACMTKAGAIHADVIEHVVPTLLREGISEARLCSEIHAALLDRHAMGISRYNQSIAEDVIGYCSFGENGIASGGLDSPTGSVGTSLAMKSIGSTERYLNRNELIVLDISSGYLGYHTDKTMNYFFGDPAAHPAGYEILRAHEICVQAEKLVASMLVPGAIPSEVYRAVLASVPEAFQDVFMNGVTFVGHSLGLTMDEKPVLANKFDAPMEKNMVFAVEPKIRLAGVGLVGTENTYLVGDATGAKSLSGSPDAPWIIPIP